MKSRIILFAIIISASTGFYSCSQNGQPKTQEVKKLPLVKVSTVALQPFTDNLKVVGVVKPFATAKLSSEEGGLIISIAKNKGDYVSKGQVVVRLKKDTEGATYEQTLAQVELAKVNFQKTEMLYNENATTELQYLTAKWQLEAAERGLRVLETRMGKGYVRSPISGVVDEKYMNKGEMSAPGMPIMNIVDVSQVKITAGIPEKYVREIKRGQVVRITSDVLPGVEFSGKINYIAPTLSAVSRTFEIEVVINNKDRILKPEMNANIELTKTRIEDAIVLNQDLIVDLGGDKYVFILEGDAAKKRIITIAGRNGNDVLIGSGLKPGETLIIEGFQPLQDGDKVQVI